MIGDPHPQITSFRSCLSASRHRGIEFERFLFIYPSFFFSLCLTLSPQPFIRGSRKYYTTSKVRNQETPNKNLLRSTLNVSSTSILCHVTKITSSDWLFTCVGWFLTKILSGNMIPIMELHCTFYIPSSLSSITDHTIASIFDKKYRTARNLFQNYQSYFWHISSWEFNCNPQAGYEAKSPIYSVKGGPQEWRGNFITKGDPPEMQGVIILISAHNDFIAGNKSHDGFVEHRHHQAQINLFKVVLKSLKKISSVATHELYIVKEGGSNGFRTVTHLDSNSKVSYCPKIGFDFLFFGDFLSAFFFDFSLGQNVEIETHLVFTVKPNPTLKQP
eukprot:sb/3466644/